MVLDPNFRAPVAIGLGAIAGALSRYYITLFLAQRLGSQFPYGTVFVNLTGCFLMGFLATLFAERLPSVSPDLKLLLTTGFLGAYTTFSTYGLDKLSLLRQGGVGSASFYWLGSTLLGLLCVHLGTLLVQK